MTEEDTFRVLTRIPINKMKRIALDNIPDMDTIEEADAFLRKYGWTVNAFEIALGVPPEHRSY